MVRISALGGARVSLNTVNSTFSGNTAAAGDGGVVFGLADSGASAALDLLYTTVTGNTAGAAGGAVNAAGATTLTLANSIVAANTAASAGEISSVQPVTVNYSLLGDAPGKSGGITITSGTGGNLFDTAPGLGALADNGGPTLTHAVTAGSAVIAMADQSATGSVSAAPATDQRGAGFARVRDGAPEMGAVESGGGGGGSSGTALAWPALAALLLGISRRRARG